MVVGPFAQGEDLDVELSGKRSGSCHLKNEHLQVLVGRSVARIAQHKPRRPNDHVCSECSGLVCQEERGERLFRVFHNSGVGSCRDAGGGGGSGQPNRGVGVVGHFWKLGNEGRVDARGVPRGDKPAVVSAFRHVDVQGVLLVAKDGTEFVRSIDHVHEEPVARQAGLDRRRGFHGQGVPWGVVFGAIAEDA